MTYNVISQNIGNVYNYGHIIKYANKNDIVNPLE